MKKIYKGIHKRLNFLIEHHTKGYDIDYKIKKVAQEWEFPEYKVRQLYTETAEKNMLHYEELLLNGVDIDIILQMMKKDNKIIQNHFNSIFYFI